MVARNKVAVKYLWTILLCVIVGGCTSLDSTKPNEPFHGFYPDSFNKIIEKVVKKTKIMGVINYLFSLFNKRIFVFLGFHNENHYLSFRHYQKKL